MREESSREYTSSFIIFHFLTYKNQLKLATLSEDKKPPGCNSMMFVQVTATDGDKDRPENIVYFLTGQGIDTDRPDQSKFDINKTTGEIFVLKVTQ